MANKTKNAKFLPLILFLVLIVFALGGTVTFAKFHGGYEKKNQAAKIADAVMKTEINSAYRYDSQKNKFTAAVNKNSSTITISDVEPEDKIECYFTVSGADEKRINEVTMKAVLSISVRLETVSAGKSGKSVDYFAGWKEYTLTDGIKDGGCLEIYHGSETDTGKDIRPSGTGSTEVDYNGNVLLIVTENESIVNKTGFIMGADDEKKEYAYHIIFKLPRQNFEKENYAGARVCFDIRAVAEQVQNV